MQPNLISTQALALFMLCTIASTGCAQTTLGPQPSADHEPVSATDPLPQPDPNYVPPTPPDPAGNKLLNLHDQSITRPQTYERVWPASPGEADICLYADDKFAAVNITIDDNTVPNHQWWLQQCALHDIEVTWFIVVDALTDYAGPSSSYFGSWRAFNGLLAEGQNVQSHSVTHDANDDTRADYLVHYEYAISQQLIEQYLPGNRCLTIAYPNGRGREDLAALYFIAARGVIGSPNTHYNVDYMNVHSGGNLRDNVDVLLTGSSRVPWHDARHLRSWASHHYHLIHDADKPELEADIAYMASKRDQLWVDTFENIAMYSQERDSATLTVAAATGEGITFTLTDRMTDSVFTYPLTVKVRLFDGWPGVTATQGDQPVEATVVEHHGADYALVKAVPDRGEVLLVPGRPGDADGDGDVDLDDFVTLKQHFGITTGATRAEGDFDSDGDVDLDDFVVLKQSFGISS